MPLQIYPGIDPIGSPPVTAGKGVWATIKIPADGDDRSAASVNTALQGLTNRTNWIGQHMINGADGGSYSGPLSLTRVQVLANIAPGPVNTAISVQSDIAMTAHDITCRNLTAVTLVSAPTVDAVVGAFSGDLDVGDDAIIGGNLTVTGYQPIRVTTAPDANTTYSTPQDFDLIRVPASLAADRTYTLGTGGPNNVPITFSWAVPAGTHKATITDGSTTFANLNPLSTTPISVTLIKIAGTWEIMSWIGDPLDVF